GIPVHGLAGSVELARGPAGGTACAGRDGGSEAPAISGTEWRDQARGSRKHRRAEARRAEHGSDARENGAAPEGSRRSPVERDRTRRSRARNVPGGPQQCLYPAPENGALGTPAAAGPVVGPARSIASRDAQAAVGDSERAAQAPRRDRQRGAGGPHRVPGGGHTGAKPRRGARAAEERGAGDEP